MPRNRFHIMVTHDGNGLWRLYLNGHLAKQRKIDMTGITLADDAGARKNAGPGTGHRTVIGARQGTSAIARLARQGYEGASVYGSMLSPAQVKQLYRRNFLGDVSQADITPVDRWPADNVSGATLTAMINPANNGTITSGYKVAAGKF